MVHEAVITLAFFDGANWIAVMSDKPRAFWRRRLPSRRIR